MTWLESCETWQEGGFPNTHALAPYYARFIGKEAELVALSRELEDQFGELYPQVEPRVWTVRGPEVYSMTVWLTSNQAMLIKLTYR